MVYKYIRLSGTLGMTPATRQPTEGKRYGPAKPTHSLPIISCLAPLVVQCPIGSIKFRLSFCFAFNLYYVRPVIIFSVGYIACYIITKSFMLAFLF